MCWLEVLVGLKAGDELSRTGPVLALIEGAAVWAQLASYSAVSVWSLS